MNIVVFSKQWALFLMIESSLSGVPTTDFCVCCGVAVHHALGSTEPARRQIKLGRGAWVGIEPDTSHTQSNNDATAIVEPFIMIGFQIVDSKSF